MAPISEPVKFKYLGLPNGLSGRGGALRFFFLAAGVPFEEDLIPMDEWYAGKKQAVTDSGEAPLGVLPVVYIGGKKYLEHIATIRYIARRLGLYGSDAEADHAADAVGDEYPAFRNAWVVALMSSDDAEKAAYAAARPKYYDNLATIISVAGGSGAHTTASGSLTHADALVFSILWDDSRVHGADELKARLSLLAFYNAFKALPAVAKWCDAKDAAAAK